MATNLFDLTGRSALVTGGAQGLGRGMATGLAEAGAKVVLWDLNEKVYQTAEEITKETGNKVEAVIGDLSDNDAIDRVFAEAIEKLGGTITILINCAGVALANPIADYPKDKWDLTMQVNIYACYHLAQLAYPYMKKNHYGKIINMASMLSFFGGKGSSSYAVSKGGVMQMTKAMSNEWAEDGITVNAFAPGYMDTTLNTFIKNNPERVEQITSRIPKGRWGTPEDIKGPAIFFSSAASDYVTGAILPVDGGYLVK